MSLASEPADLLMGDLLIREEQRLPLIGVPLLGAVLAEPGADEPKLVYADWVGLDLRSLKRRAAHARCLAEPRRPLCGGTGRHKSL